MTTKEKLELLRQLNRQDILDAMLVLDSSDNYAVGNQYFNVVLNPDNENSYPLRELLLTALDTKGITYEGDVLFEKPTVGSPMYLIFDELGFDYMSKNELFFRGFEKDDIEDFKNIISHLEYGDLREFLNLITTSIAKHELELDDQRLVFKCQEDESYNKGYEINNRLIFFISSSYNCDLSDNHVSGNRFGFKSRFELKNFPDVSYPTESGIYYRVDHAIQALYETGYHEAIKYDLQHSTRSNQIKHDNPIFRRVCFDENLRKEVLEYHKLFFSKRLTRAGIRDFLNQITDEGIALAMDEIENNSFPRTRRIKYYKALHKVSKKAFAPPLLIEKAYEHSVHKELPAGFFKGIGKGSEFFKFLEENGFDVLKTEINMTYQEFLANLTYNDFQLAINERGHEIEMDEWKKHSVFYQGKYYNSRKLIRLTDPNNDIANTDNYSSYTSITATRYLSDIGFNMNGNEIRYYIKRVLNQDVERTFSISNESATDFFELELENGEEHTISLNYVNENKTEETVIQKRNTRNEHRFFPEYRNEIEESDILLFQNNNGDYSMEIIKPGEQFENLDLLLTGKNHLLTNSIQIEHGINLKESKMSNQPLNQILYGPPGTGKTYSTITKALDIIGVDYEDYEEAQQLFQEQLGNRIEFVTMHQSFSYEDFVQGLKPKKGDTGVEFDYKNGVFKEICRRAKLFKSESGSTSSKDRIDFDVVYDYAFRSLIENDEQIELDRGHTKFIIHEHSEKTLWFETSKGTRHSRYTLAKKTLKKIYDAKSNDIIKSGNKGYFDATLEYLLEKENELLQKPDISTNVNHVIILDEINRANISRVFGELIALIEEDKRDGRLTATLPSGDAFTVPSNLYIIGTMNTADKSIALVDIALRRRFKFVAKYPNTKVLRGVLEDKGLANSEIDRRVKVLTILNQIIRAKKTVDYEIGHSYFMSGDRLEDIMNDQVLPLLNEYFMYDLRAVKALLEKKQKDRDKKDIPQLGVVFDPEEFKNRGLLKIKSIDPSNVVVQENDNTESETDEEE